MEPEALEVLLEQYRHVEAVYQAVYWLAGQPEAYHQELLLAQQYQLASQKGNVFTPVLLPGTPGTAVVARDTTAREIVLSEGFYRSRLTRTYEIQCPPRVS